MRKINKIINIALIFMLMGVPLCPDSVYALRVPIDQKITTNRALEILANSMGVRIRKIYPEEYLTYAEIIAGLAVKEKEMLNQIDVFEEDKRKSIIAWEVFEYVSSILIDKGNHENILALFVVTDKIDKKILGVRLLEKNEGTAKKNLGLDTVSGEDAILLPFRRQGLGLLLRRAALNWLIENGYSYYLAFVHDNNEKSLNNFKKVCRDMGLSFIYKYPKRIKKGHYYFIVLDAEKFQKDESIKKLIQKASLETLEETKSPESISDFDTKAPRSCL